MTSSGLPEVWLRGAVAGVPPLLQPVAHALLQAREEVHRVMRDFPSDRLWVQPAGLASAGFHLQHMAGVVDRLFTYARGDSLDDAQRSALATEGNPRIPGEDTTVLLRQFDERVDQALAQLRATDEATITEARPVGRAQLPSTVLGLLFHAAEHVQRHVGQLLVTVRVVDDTELFTAR